MFSNSKEKVQLTTFLTIGFLCLHFLICGVAFVSCNQTGCAVQLWWRSPLVCLSWISNKDTLQPYCAGQHFMWEIGVGFSLVVKRHEFHHSCRAMCLEGRPCAKEEKVVIFHFFSYEKSSWLWSKLSCIVLKNLVCCFCHATWIN